MNKGKQLMRVACKSVDLYLKRMLAVGTPPSTRWNPVRPVAFRWRLALAAVAAKAKTEAFNDLAVYRAGHKVKTVSRKASAGKWISARDPKTHAFDILAEHNANYCVEPASVYNPDTPCYVCAAPIGHHTPVQLLDCHRSGSRVMTAGIERERKQANVGTEILREKYPDLEVDMIYTLLFEIVYPGNRIVVNYGDRRDLVLVAAINRLSGESAPAGTLSSIAASNGLLVARSFGSTITAARPNSEGVVLHFENADLRVKVKYVEYVQLHRLLTHASPRTVWESLRAGTFGTPDDAIRIPKQYREWAFAAAAKIRGDFDEVHREAFAAYSALDKSQSRKDLARYILNHHAGIAALLFALLDGKNISDRIWQMVRPAAGRPFWGAGEDTDHD